MTVCYTGLIMIFIQHYNFNLRNDNAVSWIRR